MTIGVTDLTTLDPAAVNQNLAASTELLQELEPSLDLAGSVLEDLVLYYSAVLETASQTEVNQLAATGSALQLEANPNLADATTLANFFSRYLITPQAAAAAQGAVTIVVSANTTVTIAQGAVFDAAGQQFTSNLSYVAKAEASQINSATDVLLVPLLNGQYAFTISVTAVTAGSAGNVAIKTPFIPEVQPSNFLSAFASSDFSGGLNAQTLNSLLNQLQEGISAKALSDRTNMTAALHTAFPTTLTSSIIGAGDPEMPRDAHTIWPMHFGGRVDWYVQTQAQVQQLRLQLTATLLQINGDGSGLWQFPIQLGDAPGYYEIRSILLPSDVNTSGGFPIVSETRAVNLTGAGPVDVANILEGAYTSFQVATVQFTDNVTSTTHLAVGATATYAVTVALMPNLAEIQALFGSRLRRNTGGDVLIKAPVPCFTQLSFTIRISATDTAPDMDAIANALAARVAQVGFTGYLSASILQDVVYGFLTSDMTVSSIHMLGRIARPDGTDQVIFSTEELKIPDLPAVMTTPNTVLFFLDPADVAIAIETAAPIAV